MNLQNCDQITLGAAGDLVAVGMRTIDKCEILKPNYNAQGANVGIFADLLGPQGVGNGPGSVGGLDAGTRQPNTDYWLFIAANKDSGTFGLVWSTQRWVPNCPGYTHFAPIMWNRTNASGKLLPIQKVNYECSFIGEFPRLATGPTNGWQSILMTPFIGLDAAKIRVVTNNVNPGATVGVMPDLTNGVPKQYSRVAGSQLGLEFELLMSTGYIYWAAVGGATNATLDLLGFEDVI